VFERFTDKARTAVVLAQEQCRQRGDDVIGTEHLLFGLFRVPDGLAAVVLAGLSVRREDVEADLDGRRDGPGTTHDADALAALGIDLDEVRRRVEDAFGPGALDRASRGRRRRRSGGHIPFSRQAKKALELSLREALLLRHNYIGTEHLLLGLLHGEGAAHDALAARGARLDVARVIVEELVRGRRAS
jgi:ATP-dependent Clp protease ATP-binding subunit ClpA